MYFNSKKVEETSPSFSVNATVLHGSDKFNVIPSEVSVELDGRLLPGYNPGDMIAELRVIIGRDVELEVLHFGPGPAMWY